jgi:hypothetical protein
VGVREGRVQGEGAFEFGDGFLGALLVLKDPALRDVSPSVIRIEGERLGRQFVGPLKVAFRVAGKAIREGLGVRAISLQASGADSLIFGAAPKAAAQAIRKAYDLGWAPERFVVNDSSSIIAVMKPAGLDKSKGVITAIYGKDPTDPRWKDDAGVKEWKPSPQNISAPRISRTNSRSTAAMSRS